MATAFMNTPIPAQFTINVSERALLEWFEERTEEMYELVFLSFAKFLQHNLSKDAGKVALIHNDDKNNFKFGAIITYHAPSGEDDEKGNFSIEFTLDKGDLKDIIPQNIYNTSDDAFSAMCDRVMKESYRARWEDNRCMHIMIGMVIDTLVDYLAANAKNPGGVEVELAGFFLASAAVEDGQVVISILPGDLLKRTIKNDAAA